MQTPVAGSRAFARKFVAALLFVLLGAVFLCGGLFLYLRIGLDDDLVARTVVAQLDRSLDSRVTLGSAHLEWLSLDTAQLSIENLEIRDKSDSFLIFSVTKIDLQASVSHLVTGTLLVDSIRLNGPTLHLRPASEREQCAGGPAASCTICPVWLKPILRKVEMSRGRVFCERAAADRRQRQIALSDVQAEVTNLTAAGAEQFVLNGLLPGEAGTGSFQASGRLACNPLSGEPLRGEAGIRVKACPATTAGLLASSFGYDLPLAQGEADANLQIRGDPSNFNATGELSLLGVVLTPGKYFLGKTTIPAGTIRCVADRRGQSLRVDLQEATLPGAKVSAQASFEGFSSSDSAAEITVREADFQLEQFFPLIPLNLLDADDRNRLIAAGLKGHMGITAANWRGNLSQIESRQAGKGTLLIDVSLDKVSGFIPGSGLPVQDASGRLRVNQEEMVFNGISLTLGTSPIVLNGWIRDLKTSPKSDLFISMTAQAQDLMPIIEQSGLAGQVRPHLGWLSEPQGGISITLDVKGPLKNPSLKGRVVLEDFECRVTDFPLSLRKVNGALRFRGKTLAFSGLKGMVGESAAELSGDFSSADMRLTGEVKLVPSDLRKLKVLPESWTISGVLPLSIDLKGWQPSTAFTAKLDLKKNALRLGTYVAKAAGVPMEIEASGNRDAQGITLDEAYLTFPGSRVSAKASVDASNRLTAAIHLPPKGVETNVLIPLADPCLELQPGGRVEGDAVIKTDLARPRDVSIDGNLLLNHVSLNLGFYKRVEGLTGSIRCRGRSINATATRIKIGQTELSGKMSITDFSRPKLDILLDVGFLDTTDFTAPAGYVAKVTWGQWIRSQPVIRFLARSTGSALINVAKGKTAVRVFSDLSAKLEDNHGEIKSQGWRVKFAGGTLTGDGLIDIRETTSRPLRLDFQGDHLKMDRVLAGSELQVNVEGDVLVEGHLEWQLTTNRENHGIRKTGRTEVDVRNGVIHRFDALTKIFSSINLGSLVRGRLPDIIADGLPFQRMSWTTEVFDTKWKVKDLKLLSDAARVDASGMYFSQQERIDFKVEVAPLVGLDTLMSGLFGNLITRDGKTLTAMFRVRGLPGSPDVRLEPFENLKLEDR
ncbi:MAG: hypothetical protein HY914_09510 [Desulfomonile tiedjei]|nr:hypothetical protein [Desulfomonile tiedjei]